MQFSTKIDGFEQNDSQGFENSYNSYEQYPLENFFIFTIYQNYTLALRVISSVIFSVNLHRVYFGLLCILSYAIGFLDLFERYKFPCWRINKDELMNLFSIKKWWTI